MIKRCAYLQSYTNQTNNTFKTFTTMDAITWSDFDKVEKKAKNGFGMGLAGVITGGLALLKQNGGNGILGGLFNGGQSGCAGDANDPHVSKDAFYTSALDIQKEFGRQEYANLKANYDLYLSINNRLVELEKKEAVTSATLPLAFANATQASERYTDQKIGAVDYAMARQFGVVETQLASKINGTLGLPWSDIITGVPKMPRCHLDVSCEGNGR